MIMGVFNMNKKNKITGTFVVALLLSGITGCASLEHPPAMSNSPLDNLSAVAVNTSNNIREIAALKTSQLQNDSSSEQWREFMFNLKSIPPKLNKKETFRFVGTVGKATKGIADQAGMTFHAIGHAPSQSILVNLNSDNEMLINSLRDINAQIGSKAKVTISPKANLITLTYSVEG